MDKPRLTEGRCVYNLVLDCLPPILSLSPSLSNTHHITLADSHAQTHTVHTHTVHTHRRGGGLRSDEIKTAGQLSWITAAPGIRRVTREE